LKGGGRRRKESITLEETSPAKETSRLVDALKLRTEGTKRGTNAEQRRKKGLINYHSRRERISRNPESSLKGKSDDRTRGEEKEKIVLRLRGLWAKRTRLSPRPLGR